MFEFNDKRFLNLQLFAGEGGAAGSAPAGGEGSGNTGVSGAVVSTPDAEEQALRELGVPEDVLRRRKNRAKRRPGKSNSAVEMATPATAAATEVQTQQDATATNSEPTNQEGDQQAATTKRLSWDEIMADPEYKKQHDKAVKAVVHKRVNEENSATETLKKITPMLEVLARKHGMDMNNIDYEALANHVNNDAEYYRELALKNGTSVETAMLDDQNQRNRAREQAEQKKLESQKRHMDHYDKLRGDAVKLKEKYPEFDLDKELQDNWFFRNTAINGGLSLEQAYEAKYHKQIMEAREREITQRVTQQISSSMQSGRRRPDENGVVGNASPVHNIENNRVLSRKEAADLRARVEAARRRGERIYPNQF